MKLSCRLLRIPCITTITDLCKNSSLLSGTISDITTSTKKLGRLKTRIQYNTVLAMSNLVSYIIAKWMTKKLGIRINTGMYNGTLTKHITY